ncbi:uncharacterized protein C10orf67, mitochondrial-like isoform X3 [Acropora millepora]|uniref:uncharacterized protein C10orf67, mitochondrial-like isoform X3 n=1 Tax=Acropora millepora TaxID=45264 RepID=UPI001CF28122|nr:uncharacterized protein C10orf67, mitochondrial-like isoform X3 [Acropora millepora]
MAAAMETITCKSTDVPRSPKLMANAASRPGSISPALSPLSPALMELDDYRPSLADQIRVGYFSQDRSAQTNVSEIIQLKEMTEVLQNLVSDIETLKRSLHYAKHVLQADYENKLQERALDLYCRVNDRILELEKQHEERVNVIRRSYRQQLADAITQIANQHEVYYVKKSKQDNAAFSQKLKKVQDDDDENRKAQQQQDSLIEMMKMQMKDAQERADRQLEEALQRKQSVSSVSTDPEIYELRDEVEKLENKLDEMMNQLEDKETENRRLARDIDDLNEELNRERGQTRQLKRELSDALLSAEQERNSFKAELQRQKVQLQSEMDAKIQETKKNLMAASQKQVEELQRAHAEKIREQQLLDERRRNMESQQKESSIAASTSSLTGIALTHPVSASGGSLHGKLTYNSGLKVPRLNRMEKPQVQEPESYATLRKLQNLEKKQKEEIDRLKKEHDRVNRAWEIKVNVLKRTLHALKNESFLRTCLQRQASRLQQAAVTYASDGPAIFAGDRRVLPGRIFKTLETPGKMKETVPFSQAQRQYADTPFSEDRQTPAPQDEDELQRSEKSSVDVIPGQSGVATNENTTKSESSISSRQVVDPV